MGANPSIDATVVAPFSGGNADASFVVQSLDSYGHALVEFHIALYAIHSAKNYPKELTGIRDEISKHAILYKTLHLKAFVHLIDHIINAMEYFILLDCETFMKNLNNILSESQTCEACTSVVAAIHNRLVCNVDVIKEEASAQRTLAERRFNHYKDIKDSVESEKKEHYNAAKAQGVKDSRITNAATAAGTTASPSAIKLPAVAVVGVIRGIANRFMRSSSEKKDEHEVEKIIKAIEDCIVKALEADIEKGKAKEAIDELAGSTGNSISEFDTFTSGIAKHLNIFHCETSGFKTRAMTASETIDLNKVKLEYIMLQSKAKLILEKCKEFKGFVPIMQQRLSFLNDIGSDDGNKRIVEDWLTAESGSLMLSKCLIKDDSSSGTKYDFLLRCQHS